MPAHGHGLPTQPRVSADLGGGEYQLSGLKFNMAGEWVLVFDVQQEQQFDRISVNLQIGT